MDSVISIGDGETRATPNKRFEALMREPVPWIYSQEFMDRDLYEATKEGDVNTFMDELEKVSRLRKLDLPVIFYQVTPSGNSLLHVAASSGSDDVVELILIYFPDMVTHKNSSEDTPLHVAVQDQRFKAAEMLIHMGTVLEIIYWKNKDGKSPLYLAIENCKWQPPKRVCFEILQLLLQEYAEDEAYADKIQGMSPVLAGLEKRGKAMLEAIIDRLPKLLHVRDENGGTLLHVAASAGNYSAVELLLNKCPDLALQTDKDGSYPVHIACEGLEGGDIGVISMLLRCTWPDLAEIKNKKGQNIVHVAAKAGKQLAVWFICGCCTHDITCKLVNSKDDDGNTPLHLASMHNHCEVMLYLTKEKELDLRLRNNDGLTALDVAMESRSLSTRNPALVGRAILIVAGVPRSEGRDILSLREQGSGANESSPTKRIKDQVNTLLLVATLVASVTFTAGLTLPGGYNASGDLHPGTATMLYHGAFKVFVIANTFAMYNSILVVVVLLWSPGKDFYVLELAYHLAGPLLSMALTGMSVAFFAAVTVVVSKLTWLGSLILSMGVFFLVMVILVLVTLIFPFSKPAMRIVSLYYVVLFVVTRFVRLYVRVFDFIKNYFVRQLLLA